MGFFSKNASMNLCGSLKISTDNTLELLKEELKIQKKVLEQKWHFASLEKPDLLVNDIRKFSRSLKFNPYDESGGQSSR